MTTTRAARIRCSTAAQAATFAARLAADGHEQVTVDDTVVKVPDVGPAGTVLLAETALDLGCCTDDDVADTIAELTAAGARL